MWFKTLSLSLLSTLLLTPSLLAKGLVTVEQIDGNVDNYVDVEIFSTEDTLYLKPAEGPDIVVIEKKNCKLEDNIQVCSDGTLTLDTYGVEENIEIDQLFIFTNNTDKRLPIQKSDVTLKGKTIMLEILTSEGTYITGMGRIDQTTPPEN